MAFLWSGECDRTSEEPSDAITVDVADPPEVVVQKIRASLGFNQDGESSVSPKPCGHAARSPPACALRIRLIQNSRIINRTYALTNLNKCVLKNKEGKTFQLGNTTTHLNFARKGFSDSFCIQVHNWI